ncbi:MAG: COX15/CtaA family protein [Burkholderiales bacterium]|nr:COX15/CtaA family protein [Burkholderiales bacterium]
MNLFKKLSVLAVVWTFGLVVLGAYVRLSNAGLGCPDWPGCYGHPTPVHAIGEISAAQAQSPTGPVSLDKAWKEMVHRYVAGGLGLLVVILAALAIKHRDRLRQSPALPVAVFFLICLQGAFGAWTVTMKLRPAIVTGHLLFGLSTLALLVWSALRQREWAPLRSGASFRPYAMLGLLIVIAQIMLGGWVSTNYAALVCSDFPTCQGALVPAMDFHDGFSLLRELGKAPDGHMLTLANLTAIHWLHRLGALITFCYLSWLAMRLYRAHVLRSLALAVLFALLLQVSLGIGNVLLQLPLPVAVLHNAGAALLLSLMVAMNFRLARVR